jgi:[ribosomal protein S5]-alanine N-acetyltransferase
LSSKLGAILITNQNQMHLNSISNRICIRNLKDSDLNDFFSYRSNREITKYQGFDTMTIGQCKDFIDSQKDMRFGKAGEWVQYAIEDLESNRLIGDCAIKLDDYDVRIAQIGITISPEFQQKGYAKETMKTILDFLFSIEDFHRVVEIVDAENEASIKLLESLGFRKEGHFVENIFFKGKWGSEFQYAMLKSEYNNE